MDIFSEFTGGSSIWIKKIVYDLSVFELRVILIDDPIHQNQTAQLVFPNIISFDETIEEYDADLLDSIVGVHRLEDAATICIKTEIREIFIKSTTNPYVEKNT